MIKDLMLVDDDSDDVSFFREALQEIDPGIRFHSANNGLKALELLLNKQVVIPGLIFLDINMPLMNGWQCLAELKNLTALNHIPVAMYSTSSLNTDLQKALNLGAIALYQKPERYEELKQLITNVIRNLA